MEDMELRAGRKGSDLMLIFDLMMILMTILLLWFGLYFLKFKKDRNRTSLVMGYLYLLVGIISLITVIVLMI